MRIKDGCSQVYNSRMKRLLFCAAFALSMHGQSPALAPFGAWTVCAYVSPIPIWAVDICAAQPADTPQPWMLAVWASRSETVAFRYQVEYTDAAGVSGEVSGVFLRADQKPSSETIFYPVPGLIGKLQQASVRVQELSEAAKEGLNQ